MDKFLEELQSLEDDKLALHHMKFFKTAKGEYGEGDLFLGLKVPQVRALVKKSYTTIPLDGIATLIQNPYHEIRLAALLLVVKKYEKGTQDTKEEIFKFYLENVKYINNWDLVDLTAPHIAGDFAFNHNAVYALKELSNSTHLWSERISIIATLYFIRKNGFNLTLELCEKFLTHKHDLIHKACGWMLRETGKRNIEVLYSFLDKKAPFMPRTMLRYAIEKLAEDKRKAYLAVRKIANI